MEIIISFLTTFEMCDRGHVSEFTTSADSVRELLCVTWTTYSFTCLKTAVQRSLYF